jgi:hypothetical protein
MLGACEGASPKSDWLPRSNSSAEDQARRSGLHACIARICASSSAEAL